MTRELDPDLPTAKPLLNHNPTGTVHLLKDSRTQFRFVLNVSCTQRHLGSNVNALPTIERIWAQHKKYVMQQPNIQITMNQIFKNCIFLIRFTFQSHVMPGHQAEWIGMTMQEAMGDGEANWR